MAQEHVETKSRHVLVILKRVNWLELKLAEFFEIPLNNSLYLFSVSPLFPLEIKLTAGILAGQIMSRRGISCIGRVHLITFSDS